MTKLMKFVHHDLMDMGTEGEMVEVVKKIIKHTKIEIVSQNRSQTMRVNKDTYLVNSSAGSRAMIDGQRDKNVKFIVDEYEGNDLYSPYELGLESRYE